MLSQTATKSEGAGDMEIQIIRHKADLMKWGKLFQSLGATTKKAQLPLNNRNEKQIKGLDQMIGGRIGAQQLCYTCWAGNARP